MYKYRSTRPGSEHLQYRAHCHTVINRIIFISLIALFEANNRIVIRLSYICGKMSGEHF